jgi:hypothetical protein
MTCTYWGTQCVSLGQVRCPCWEEVEDLDLADPYFFMGNYYNLYFDYYVIYSKGNLWQLSLQPICSFERQVYVKRWQHPCMSFPTGVPQWGLPSPLF